MANLLKKQNIHSKKEENLPSYRNKTLSLTEFNNNTRYKCNQEDDKKKRKQNKRKVFVTIIIYTTEFFFLK